MRILYGANDTYLNATEKLIADAPAVIEIPQGDEAREAFFGGDPVFGFVKHVVIQDDFGRVYVAHHDVSCTIERMEDGRYRVNTPPTPEMRLAEIHKGLQLKHGSLTDEYPEQIMAVRYVKPDATVLEIGGNVGRNSCVIASILADASKQHVVLESDGNIAKQLCENRDINGLGFHVIPAALSKRRLIQAGWDTTPIAEDQDVPDGWHEIPTMTWTQIQEKSAELGVVGAFDTLVADCEGALYYILQDEPNIFQTFHTVIMENDYFVLAQKEYVDEHLRKNGMHVVYQKSGGWGPCYNRFFEVWQRQEI